MTIAPRNVIGAMLALAVMCLVGWLSTSMWDQARRQAEPVGTVEITPLE